VVKKVSKKKSKVSLPTSPTKNTPKKRKRDENLDAGSNSDSDFQTSKKGKTRK